MTVSRSLKAVAAILAAFFIAGPVSTPALAGPVSTPALAGDAMTEQKQRISNAERNLEVLSSRLTGLFTKFEDVTIRRDAAAGSLGANRVRIDRTTRKIQQARARLNQRARKAYMLGVGQHADMVLSVGDPRKLFALSKFVGSSIDEDLASIKELNVALEANRAAATAAREHTQTLQGSSEEMEQLRAEIQRTINEQQQTLASATAELSRLEQERKRREAQARKRVSIAPAGPVAAARSRRQAELDAKLKALLAWYAPGTGASSFTPPKLKPTGIVTSGIASWYGPGFHGRRASSGTTYDQNQLTAASLVLPFGTLVKVTYKDRSAVVVITDRGPYVAPRVIDLSAATAQALGLGLGQVTMEIMVPVGSAPSFP